MSAPTHENPQSISMGKSKPLQTLRITTCNPLLAQRNPGDILDWIELNAESIFIQQIAPGKRSKNRAIVQYRDDSGEVKAVGGATIWAAVARARMRMEASADSSAKGGS